MKCVYCGGAASYGNSFAGIAVQCFSCFYDHHIAPLAKKISEAKPGGVFVLDTFMAPPVFAPSPIDRISDRHEAEFHRMAAVREHERYRARNRP